MCAMVENHVTETSVDPPQHFVNQATIQFNNKLNRMAKNFDKHTAFEVETLLKETLDNVQRGSEVNIQPNVVTFVASINAWARCTRRDSGKKAEDMLDLLLKLSEDSDNVYFLDLKPNAIAYNAAITAWIRSGSHGSHNNAERLLNQLWKGWEDTKDDDLKPTDRSFNLVINSIARSREPGCADRALVILQRMSDLYSEGNENMEPDASTFGAIINAYANEGDAADKAAQILQQMESLYQLGYQKVKPNTFVYNACLNAFAKSAQKEPGNAEKANQLLEMIEHLYAKGDSTVRPDVISYATCINAHANSARPNSGAQASAILKRMTQVYLQGDEKAKPNAVAYTSTIKAWLASAEAEPKVHASSTVAEIVETILEQMTMQCLAGDADQKPTRVTFDLVSESMLKAGDTVGRDRVEKLRQRILYRKRSGKGRPIT